MNVGVSFVGVGIQKVQAFLLVLSPTRIFSLAGLGTCLLPDTFHSSTFAASLFFPPFFFLFFFLIFPLLRDNESIA